MTIESLLEWREPLVDDWRGQIDDCAAMLDAGDAGAAGRLRRLASMRLGDGERLRLRRLVKNLLRKPSPPAGFRVFRMLLVSNRTLSFFAGDLEAAGVARGLLIETIETDYDSVRALALAPPAPSDPKVDAVLLLLDAAFFQADGALLDADREAETADRAGQELGAILEGLRTRFQAAVIAATAPAPPELQLSSADRGIPGAQVRLLHSVNEAMVESARAGLATLFDLSALATRIGTMAFFDPVRFLQAKTPFSLEAGPVVADALAALVAAMCGRSGRVLVLDLDNTLWGGVVADDGVAGIAIGQGSPEGEAFLAIQQYALDLRRRGVVLAVCSKNLEEIAREPFRSHPDMLLREDHLSVFLATFDDKASNLARIAQQLDLDPSALVLLDDNPAERERVRSALPWVTVLEVGQDPAHFVRVAASSGCFEHLALTADDTRRAGAYQARAEAKALQAKIGDYDAYLESLQMELTISPFDPIGRARITQLIQKSNQFNLTTKRYSELEVAAMEGDQTRVAWQVRLKDRFADHGMISVVVVDKAGEAWSIDNWVMSCRVLERGVEAAIARELARLAAQEGAREIIGVYRPTARNGLVKELYPRLGFEASKTAEDGAQSYRLVLAAAKFERPSMSVIVNAPATTADVG